MRHIFYSIAFFFLSTSVGFSQKKLMYLEGEAQGTTYHITYYDTDGRDFFDDIEKILFEFDQSVSTYVPTSIISRINSNEKKVVVDDYFITCFKKAKEIWESTDGAFDPTVYPLVNAWGFGPGAKLEMNQEKIDSILQFVGFDKIRLKGKKVIKKDPRVSLDFNAFAQGYSVDVVSKFLSSKNITSYIVEIGGEVFAKGIQENGQNWLIGIEQPIENKETGNPFQAVVKLDGLAVATSGNYRKFIVEDGLKYAHHIDPKTGYPAKNNLLSASVFASECIASDANATGLLVMGLEKAKVFLEQHPNLQAFLIYSDELGNYQIYQTPQVKDWVVDFQ